MIYILKGKLRKKLIRSKNLGQGSGQETLVQTQGEDSCQSNEGLFMEKAKSNFQEWKMKTLSQAGRVITSMANSFQVRCS